MSHFHGKLRGRRSERRVAHKCADLSGGHYELGEKRAVYGQVFGNFVSDRSTHGNRTGSSSTEFYSFSFIFSDYPSRNSRPCCFDGDACNRVM